MQLAKKLYKLATLIIIVSSVDVRRILTMLDCITEISGILPIQTSSI
jgi:hypothetical protein